MKNIAGNQLLSTVLYTGLCLFFLTSLGCALDNNNKGVSSENIASFCAGMSQKYAKIPLPDSLGEIPKIKVPIYAMECHVWWFSPFANAERPGYRWAGGSPDGPTFGPDWMRDHASPGYPLIGLYDSEESEVIRWQIRCARNAGIDGLIVHLWPDRVTGTRLGGAKTFGNYLEIAKEEGLKIGCHDEIQFRKDWKAQEPHTMAQRVGKFIRKYGSHSAYLRIDGKPVYLFQFWDRFRHSEHWKNKTPLQIASQLDDVFKEAEKIAGESIYWILHVQPDDAIWGNTRAKGFVPTANSHVMKRVTGYKDQALDWRQVQANLEKIQKYRKKYPDKSVGLWAYVGFNDSPRRRPDGATTWMPRREGKTLVETLRMYKKENPDFIMVSSWNDWQENTAIEPGLSFDGFNGDPYLYLKILAAAKGKQFHPPELPAKEAIDPLMWQPLFGVDKIPPQLVKSRYLPLEPALVATFMDSMHPVKQAWISFSGNAFWDPSKMNTGLQLIKSKRFTKDSSGDIILKPGSTAVMQLDKKHVSTKKGDVYLAVEYLDNGYGKLEITYPTTQKFIDYRELDDLKVPIVARLSLNGNSKHYSKVILLRDFDKNANSVSITITYSTKGIPQGKTENTCNILRTHFFDAANAIRLPGTEISNALPGSQVKVYKFKSIDLLGESPKTAYLWAEDSEGNISSPYPVWGGDYNSTYIGQE